MNPQQEEKTNETQEQPSETQEEPDLKPSDIRDIPTNVLETIENTETKKKLIFTIQKYQDSGRFGKIVKYELGFKDSFSELSERSEMDLENILHRIRTHLDNKNLDKFYENMATTLSITYEQAMSLVYPIDGFSDMLLDSEDFWTTYERLRIESEFPSVNPITQMLFMIGQLTIIAHHTRTEYESSDEQYKMEEPHSLDTILEGIEEKPILSEDYVIVDKDTVETSSSSEPKEPPKPVSLGQTL